MRSHEEIQAYIKADDEIFSFTREILLPYLSLENARQFCEEEKLEEFLKEKPWFQKPQDRASILPEMKDYLEFAFGKAEDHRGLSASRSISKLKTWAWLLGDDDVVAFAEDDANYPCYGAPVLAYIARKYDWPIPDSPTIRNMAAGNPCRPGCSEGCSG